MTKRGVPVADFIIGEGHSLAFMSGPCVIEGEDATLFAADKLKRIFAKKNINFIFKSSYDKANRSSINSFRGPGLDEGLRILEKVKNNFGIPVVTDVHSEKEAIAAKEVVDVLQIPAFLCRQTDLVVTAGKTGAVISIKKGQFLSPWDMGNVIEKVLSTGNKKIICVDRGAMFGYNNLVSDFRAIPVMQNFGFPVCFDATHSVQLPGASGVESGGQREFVPILAKAAVAVGADCLFMEAHPSPDQAKSDASSQVAFEDLPKLLDELIRIYEALKL